MKFINRKKEIEALGKKWEEASSQLFIIYGKRRVGKTELIKQFLKGKPGVYFLADKRSPSQQLKELGRIVGAFFKDRILVRNGFNDWLEAFAYLKERAGSRFVLAIDEYPYLVEADGATSSLFQKGWDEYLKDTDIFMILSGSSIAMMESEALTYKAPLFGRRTGQLLIKPLTFRQSGEFFPDKDFLDFFPIYTIAGGMPAYLLQLEKKLSLKENIKENIFNKASYLHNEVEFTLKEELREPKNYLAILKAMAFGKRKFGEISNDTGLAKNVLMKYLGTLERLQIIEKEYPITEEKEYKSKKGLYKISDNFFRFWFQYVFPFKSDLEIEKYDEVMAKFDAGFNMLEAAVYEQVSRELIREHRDKLFSFEKIGRWWNKEREIDLVAVNGKTKEILFGECKWSEKPVGTDIYLDLKNKALFVDWHNDERKECFALFSKSGFTKAMIDVAKKENVLLIRQDRPENF